MLFYSRFNVGQIEGKMREGMKEKTACFVILSLVPKGEQHLHEMRLVVGSESWGSSRG